MTIHGELKVGDKIRPTQPSSWSLTYANAEVIALAKNDQGREFAWCLAKEGFGNPRSFGSFAVSVLKDSWERVETFFSIGGQYIGKNGMSETAYVIEDVYEVENPAWEGEAKAAIARVTRKDGTQYISILSEVNFSAMKKVK